MATAYEGEAVVNTGSIQGTSQSYTVPAGRYARVTISSLYFSGAGSGTINIGGATESLTAGATAYFAPVPGSSQNGQGLTANMIFLVSGETLSVTGDLIIQAGYIEYDNP